jgi:hypothetical protein
VGFGWEKNILDRKMLIGSACDLWEKHQVDFKWIKGTIITRRERCDVLIII